MESLILHILSNQTRQIQCNMQITSKGQAAHGENTNTENRITAFQISRS